MLSYLVAVIYNGCDGDGVDDQYDDDDFAASYS